MGPNPSGFLDKRLREGPCLTSNLPTDQFRPKGGLLEEVLLARWQFGITTVYHWLSVPITHRPVGLDRMDEIIVMEDGEIRARGTHEELLSANERYRGMWGLVASSKPET